MSLNLRKLEEEAGSKARQKHGIIGYRNTGKLPSGRAWKREWAAINQQYEAIRQRFGGDKIQPEVEALLNGARDARIIRGLGLLYVKKAGIMRRDSIRRGDLAMHSVLCQQFIAYLNVERLNLEAAARLAGQKIPEAPITLAEIIREVDAEAEAQAAKARETVAGGPGSAQEGRSAGDEGQDMGEGQGDEG
jgi:hypothetical protein